MPNRILKESICTSESLAGLDPQAEVFFYRLIVNCDDYGRMDARTAILRSKCFPLLMEAVTVDDVERWLAELVQAGLIRCYRWDDRPYLELVTWGKHQKIRAKRSKYPGPDGAETTLAADEDRGGQLPADADKAARNPNLNPNLNVNPDPNPKRATRSNPATRRAEPPAAGGGVTLTPDERQRLVERYGPARTERMIAALAAYKRRTGRSYRSDYRAILNWVVRKAIDQPAGPTPGVDVNQATPGKPAAVGGFDREKFLWKGGDGGDGALP